MSDNDEDPFDCFGGGDDDHDDETVRSQDVPPASTQKNLQQRDPSNGILAFHAGTEQALLHYVRQKMAGYNTDADEMNGMEQRASAIMGHIDDFCLERHWMMHVGNEKAPILESFLEECVENMSNNNPLVVLELGTYCGYSSVMISRALRRLLAPHGRSFHIYSVEVVEKNAKVAREILRLSGMSDNVDVLLFDPHRQSLTQVLQQHMPSAVPLDFVFIDHDKSRYLADFIELERSSLIQKGCFVAADNVIFAQIDDYRAYIQDLEKQGIVKTKLEMSWLEYCQPDHNGDERKKNTMKDGIGKICPSLVDLFLVLRGTVIHQKRKLTNVLEELSVYLQNPRICD